jgi:hypothetical protein
LTCPACCAAVRTSGRSRRWLFCCRCRELGSLTRWHGSTQTSDGGSGRQTPPVQCHARCLRLRGSARMLRARVHNPIATTAVSAPRYFSSQAQIVGHKHGATVLQRRRMQCGRAHTRGDPAHPRACSPARPEESTRRHEAIQFSVASYNTVDSHLLAQAHQPASHRFLVKWWFRY